MKDVEPDLNAAHFDAAKDDVFGRIANRYDVLCDVFSLFAHRRWKSAMAREIAHCNGALVLDVAAGTGHIPLRLIRRLNTEPELPRKKIIAADLSPGMLAVARKRPFGNDPSLEYRVMNAHDLIGIESGSVDIFSISFGMKIMDRAKVVRQAHRVLKSGGSFFCLEAARIPVEMLHRAYLVYMNTCLPVMARIATGGDHSAYDYLLRGIHAFPRQEEFAAELVAAGFRDVGFRNFPFGIVAMHRGVKA